MRIRAGAAFVFGLSFAMGGALDGARADEDQRLVAVVARVGPSDITVRSIEQRMREIPDFQLATFGEPPDKMRRAFLEQVMVKDALFAEGAKAKRLEDDAAVHEHVDEALRRARLLSLRSEIQISRDEVAAFYMDNLPRFVSPARVAVYRILCTTREEAVAVLAEAKAYGGLQRWNDLARDRSIDKATSLRGGNLGFLAADGSSSEVSVKTDPALFAAANRVKDGELVGEPVAEGKAYAVIWRRGSTPPVRRTVEEEEGAIRQVLLRKKLEDATRELIKKLRDERKVEEFPQLIDMIEVDSVGDVGPKKRPGVAQRKPPAPPTPSATLRGLR
jgi:peptidyl-prolyl cis-trans isomerase C